MRTSSRGWGDRFFAEFEHAMNRIRRNPFLFPRLEYYPGGLDVCRCRLHRFPFIVIFLCQGQEIVIVAVSDARRDPATAWNGWTV